jgi:preprotein translocase subunit SecD
MQGVSSLLIFPSPVHELHGCGAFASSSFDVFCRGNFKKVLKEKKCDRNVRAYALYLKRAFDEANEGNDATENPTDAGETMKQKTKFKKKQSRKRGALTTRKSTRKRKRYGIVLIGGECLNCIYITQLHNFRSSLSFSRSSYIAKDEGNSLSSVVCLETSVFDFILCVKTSRYIPLYFSG